MTPKDHSARAARLNSLGNGYLDKFIEKRTEADLELAIQYYQEAVDMTPKDHLDRAGRLKSLGEGYLSRSIDKGTEVDLDLAIQYFQEALDHVSSRTLHRLRSGITLTSVHATRENWQSAYKTTLTTLALIPALTPRSLETPDKQNILAEGAGFASGTAAIALLAKELPYEAIRLLELGRGVIIASLSEMRTDISDLQQKHPQLADKYNSLRNQLNAPTPLPDQVIQIG